MNHFWPVTCGGRSAGGCAVSGKVFSSLFPFFRMKIFSSILGYCCEDALRRVNMEFFGDSRSENKRTYGGYRLTDKAWVLGDFIE